MSIEKEDVHLPGQQKAARNKEYWVVRQGAGAMHASSMYEQNYVGVDFIGESDLTPYVTESAQALRQFVMTRYSELYPAKSKIAAGLAAGNVTALMATATEADVILAPQPDRSFAFGHLLGGYEYHPGHSLPHRRRVHWDGSFNRDDMSDVLAKASNSTVTVFSLSPQASELAELCVVEDTDKAANDISISASDVEVAVAFRLEKQLEDFLIDNWGSTSLGREFDILEEDGQQVGRQYRTDTGPMDILAISKDRRRLLVVELKRERTSDAVVGQVQRYMGFIHDELLEEDQTVEGVIIAPEEDLRIRRALSVTNNIRYMKYKISFEIEDR